MSLYKPLIKDSWSRLWANKRLWVLGIFLIFLGNEGEVALFLKNLYKLKAVFSLETASDLPLLFQSTFFGENFFAQIVRLFSADHNKMIAIAMIFALSLLSYLVFTSQATVIQASAYQKSQCSVKKVWLEQRKNYFSLLAVNSLIKLGAFILSSVLVSILSLIISYITEWDNSMFVLALFLVFTPVGIFSSFATRYATAYLVLEKMSVFESIKNGTALAVKYLLISLEMSAGIFIFTALVVGAALLISLTVVFIQLVYIYLVHGGSSASESVKTILAVNMLFSTFVVAIPLGVYIQTFWARLFQELISTTKKESKTNRVFTSFLNHKINN